MSIHQIMKDTMKKHKAKIELIQWATISSIASLVYSDYIRSFRQRTKPVHLIQVPSMMNLKEFLKTDGPFMEKLSSDFIDQIMKTEYMTKYKDQLPELVLFQDDLIEIMKTIMDLYILPNVSRAIPNVIEKKFQLNQPSNRTFIQSNDINLFQRPDIEPDEMMGYLAEEFMMQLLMNVVTMERHTEYPEHNEVILLTKDEILTIDNGNAICPIHFNHVILDMENLMKLMCFVTNTIYEAIDQGESVPLKNGEMSWFQIQTSPFNATSITKFGNRIFSQETPHQES